MERIAALALAVALTACSISVTPNAQPAPTPQAVVVVQASVAQRDTVAVRDVRPAVQRPGKVRRLVQAGTMVLAVYGARELGQKHLKWNRNTAGQRVFPFVERK